MKFFLPFLLFIPFQLWSQDTTAPVISNFWSDGDSITVFTSFRAQMPKYSVVDDTDGDITTQAQIVGSVDGSQVGSYQLSITATDKASNSAKITVNIHVVDTAAPVLLLNGDNPVCLSLGNEYVDPGVTVSDNYSTASETTITMGGNLVNTDTRGWYCLTYIATDASGNNSKLLQRTVYIDLIDSGKPCDFISGKVCGKDPMSIVAYRAPSMEVYPNPSLGLVIIRSEYVLNQVEVFTLTGQRILDITTGASSLELELPSKGLFYIMAHSDKGLVKKLVVVE